MENDQMVLPNLDKYGYFLGKIKTLKQRIYDITFNEKTPFFKITDLCFEELGNCIDELENYIDNYKEVNND